MFFNSLGLLWENYIYLCYLLFFICLRDHFISHLAYFLFQFILSLLFILCFVVEWYFLVFIQLLRVLIVFFYFFIARFLELNINLNTYLFPSLKINVKWEYLVCHFPHIFTEYHLQLSFFYLLPLRICLIISYYNNLLILLLLPWLYQVPLSL